MNVIHGFVSVARRSQQIIIHQVVFLIPLKIVSGELARILLRRSAWVMYIIEQRRTQSIITVHELFDLDLRARW